MFAFVFSLLVTLTIEPFTLSPNSPQELRQMVGVKIRSIPQDLGYYLPANFDQKFTDLDVLLQDFFKPMPGSRRIGAVKFYIFKEKHIARNEDVHKSFTLARKYASRLVKEMNLAATVGAAPGFGFHACFATTAPHNIVNINSIAPGFAISNGLFHPEQAKACFSHYWGAISKSSTGESLLVDNRASLNDEDQFMAFSQRGSNRMIVMMAQASSKEIVEVFSIDNFDEQARVLLKFIEQR